jgi:IS5 family transposase
MRQQRTIQASLFDAFAGHEIGRQLRAMSLWIDAHPELVGWVAEDLRRHSVKETGRQGLTAESVLRCALLKQHRQLSYEELAFHRNHPRCTAGVWFDLTDRFQAACA